MNPKCDHIDKDGSFLYTHISGGLRTKRYCIYCGYKENLVQDLQNPFLYRWKEATPPEFLEAVRIIVESETIKITC